VDLIVQCACAIHNWLHKSSSSLFFAPWRVDTEDDYTSKVTDGLSFRLGQTVTQKVQDNYQMNMLITFSKKILYHGSKN
jgi:hypothetical protein